MRAKAQPPRSGASFSRVAAKAVERIVPLKFSRIGTAGRGGGGNTRPTPPQCYFVFFFRVL